LAAGVLKVKRCNHIGLFTAKGLAEVGLLSKDRSNLNPAARAFHEQFSYVSATEIERDLLGIDVKRLSGKQAADNSAGVA